MIRSSKNIDTQKYLLKIRHIQTSIESKRLQLEELYSQTTSLTAYIRPDFVKNRSRKCGFENSLIRLDELKKDLENDLEVLANKLDDITKKLNSMYETYPNEANLLRLRYINNLAYEEVSNKMHCSLSTMYRTHGKALAIFKNYI